MIIRKEYNSILRCKGMRFTDLEFKCPSSFVGNDITTDFEQGIVEKEEKDNYTVTLTLKITSNDNPGFYILIRIVGDFEVCNCEDEMFKNDLIKKNTVSIMFPYVRSELTLLTTHPGFSPIQLPPINVNKLISDMENDGD